MPVLPSRRLAFIHIPKCAGSSVEEMLGVHPEVLDPALREHHLSGDVGGRRLQHFTVAEIVAALRARGEDPAEYRFCAIVRDPYRRAVSEFLWRRRINHPSARGHDLDSFMEAIHERWRADDYNYWTVTARGDVHFVPQVRFLEGGDVAAPPIDVFRLEDGLAAVAAWVAADGEPVGPVPRLNVSPVPPDLEVSDRFRAIVTAMYRCDLAAFGYPAAAPPEWRLHGSPTGSPTAARMPAP